MNDFERMAELLLGHIDKTPEYYENKILLSSPCSLPNDGHAGTATKHYLRDRHGQ